MDGQVPSLLEEALSHQQSKITNHQSYIEFQQKDPFRLICDERKHLQVDGMGIPWIDE